MAQVIDDWPQYGVHVELRENAGGDGPAVAHLEDDLPTCRVGVSNVRAVLTPDSPDPVRPALAVHRHEVSVAVDEQTLREHRLYRHDSPPHSLVALTNCFSEIADLLQMLV